MKVPTAKAKPYVLNRVDDESGEILIYDQVGESLWEEGVTAKSFATDLKALGKKIKNLTVRINSPGGSVWDGLAIYNSLKQHRAHVKVMVDGLAASIASVIAMAGDEVLMADNALMMIHNPATIVAGDAKQMREAADLMDKVKLQLVKAYTDKTGLDDDEVSNLLDEETWMSSEEAYEMGFVDGIVEDSLSLAACHTTEVPDNYQVPASLQARVENLLTGTSDRKGEDMPKNETQAPAITEPQAATLQELKALAGADNDFVVEQLEANATLAESQAVLMQRLTAQVKALTEENESLKKAKSEPQATPVAEPVAQTVAPEPAEPVQPVNVGVQPVVSTTAPTGGESDNSGKPFGGNPMAFWEKEFNALIAKGFPMNAAIKQVWKDNPGLQDAVTASEK